MAHVHTWNYTAIDAILTATCNAGECSSTNTVESLTLTAASRVYNGSAVSASVSDTTGWTTTGLTVPTIQYQKKTGETTYADATTAAPTDTGTYKASITADSATAYVEYSISKKALTVTGTTVRDKVYDGNTNATIGNVGTLEGVETGDEVKLPNGITAVFDKTTLSAVAEQAKGISIQLVVDKDTKAEKTMTTAQKATVETLNKPVVLDAYFVSGGTRIPDFKGGEAELTAEYPTTNPVRVWYVKDDGTKELIPSIFDGKMAIFTVTHFSHYVIEMLDSSSYKSCPQDATCIYAKFTDSYTKAWYHDGVHFCVENGYLVGVTTDKFAPSDTLSRGMIVTMLWRMEGSPVADYAMSFKDVADGQWYTEAIRWAQSTGVVTGYNDEAFGPNDNVTREQLAAFLMRYAAYKGIDVSKRADVIARFSDAKSISAWALENVKWANAVGIINGRTEATIVPTDNATRAEAACMVQRFCDTILVK